MKKFFLIASLLIALQSFAAGPVTVNEKVLAAFNLTFKDVQGAVWSELGNYFEVAFKRNNVLSRIQYDVEGNMMQTTRYYGEQNLPLMLLAKLQKRYAGKKVFGVTEVCTDEGTLYHIILEDATNWTIVRASLYGDMYVHQKYRKA